MTPINRTKANHFLTLDCARGIAALAVVCYHAATLGGINYESFGGYHFFGRAYLAVDLFFLMSGFVIARAYEARLLSRDMSFGQFACVRLVRLYPLYFLGLVGGSAWWLASHDGMPTMAFWSNLALETLFLPQMTDYVREPFFYPLNLVAWSLGFELAINLAFAAWLVRLPMSTLAILCGLFAILLAFFAGVEGSLDFGFRPSQLLEGIARVSASFIAGQIVFRCLEAGLLPRLRIPAGLTLGGLMIFLVAPAGIIGLPYDLAMVMAVFPGFMIAGCQSEPGPALGWLAEKMGRLSYAIYILHVPCIHWAGAAWMGLAGVAISAFPVLGGAAVGAIVLGIAALATALYDEPLRKYLVKWPTLAFRGQRLSLCGPVHTGTPSRPDLATL